MALIVAGGRGTRLGRPTPKQYLALAGEPMLVRTLRVFEACQLVDTIVLTVPASDFAFVRDSLLASAGLRKKILLAAGGLPLVVGCLFLLVLVDNLEDRVGRGAFLLFYLFCGAVAGAAHVLLGKAGAPPAIGSAGAVAGVLGAYLVFFPEVPVTMYGIGDTVSVPAYLFACAWAVGVFLWGWGPGPLSALLNPAPYGLAGNLARFGAGVAGAALWRSFEDAGSGRPAPG